MTAREVIDEKKKAMTKEDSLEHLDNLIEFAMDSIKNTAKEASADILTEEWNNEFYKEPWDDPWVQDIAYLENAKEIIDSDAIKKASPYAMIGWLIVEMGWDVERINNIHPVEADMLAQMFKQFLKGENSGGQTS